MAEPRLDVRGRHILGRLCHSTLSPVDGASRISLDRAATVEKHGQQPSGIGVAQFAGPAQSGSRLRARDELWFAVHCAVVGFIHVVDFVESGGVALIAKLTPDPQRFSFVSVCAIWARCRRFQTSTTGLERKA